MPATSGGTSGPSDSQSDVPLALQHVRRMSWAEFLKESGKEFVAFAKVTERHWKSKKDRVLDAYESYLRKRTDAVKPAGEGQRRPRPKGSTERADEAPPAKRPRQASTEGGEKERGGKQRRRRASESDSDSSSSSEADSEAWGAGRIEITPEILVVDAREHFQLDVGSEQWFTRRGIYWVDIVIREKLRGGIMKVEVDTTGDMSVALRGLPDQKKWKRVHYRRIRRSKSDDCYLPDGRVFPCGICKTTDCLEDIVFCDNPIPIRDEEKCLRGIHPACQTMAGSAQIGNQLFLCRACFPDFCDYKNRDNFVSVLQSGEAKLQQVIRERGFQAGYTHVASVLLQNARDCYDRDGKYNEKPGVPLPVSDYSYHHQSHNGWLTGLMKEAWPGYDPERCEKEREKEARAAQPEGSEPPRPCSRDVTTIDDDQDVDEAASRLVSAGDVVSTAPAWHRMVVQRLRLWDGGGPRPGDDLWTFQRPPLSSIATTEEVWESASVKGGEVSVYFVPSSLPGELDLAIWPCRGYPENVLRIPVKSIGSYCGFPEGDGAYCRIKLHRQEAKALLEGLSWLRLSVAQGTSLAPPLQLPVVPAPDRQEPPKPRSSAAQGDAPSLQRPLYLSVCCRFSYNATDSSLARVHVRAHHCLLRKLCPAAEGDQNSIAEELQWMRSSSRRAATSVTLVVCDSVKPPLRLTLAEYSRLGPPVSSQSYLNDVLIDWAMLKERSDRVFVFPAVFVNRMRSTFANAPPPEGSCGADNPLLRWASALPPASRKQRMGWVLNSPQRSLFSYDVLLFPIHDARKEHWVLGAVEGLPRLAKNPEDVARAMLLCSLGRRDTQGFLEVVQHFLAYRAVAEEWLRKERPDDIVASTIPSTPPRTGWWEAMHGGGLAPSCVRVTQQSNMIDCGVHVIVNARRLVKGEDASALQQPIQAEVGAVRAELKAALQSEMQSGASEREKMGVGSAELKSLLDRVEGQHRAAAEAAANGHRSDSSSSGNSTDLRRLGESLAAIIGQRDYERWKEIQRQLDRGRMEEDLALMEDARSKRSLLVQTVNEDARRLMQRINDIKRRSLTKEGC
eukprot:TRINITY_DN13974_c0_g1_i1.p1 TRINITY_DN13974_c0_g1~~TRINITY_DN13974_c0_g1_i1.p1  ORF type:complete len:1070 (+),score=244.95 TRINITY_DN13974_c0_g1_i1:58-3267(+)